MRIPKIIRSLTREHFLILFILVFSIFIHFIGLAKNPLNDNEARLAMASSQLNTEILPHFPSQPLYLALTSLLFNFSENNFTARFIPAMIGSFLPLIPFFYKKWTGATFAFIFSVLLLFDPVLIAASRQADSRIFVLFFGGLLIPLIFKAKYYWVGIVAGLFLLSGSLTWNFVWIILLSLTAYFFIPAKSKKKDFLQKMQLMIDGGGKKILIILFLTIIIIGSAFLLHLSLLNGFINSIIEFIQGWVANSYLFNQAIYLLVILFFSYIMLLILMLIGIGFSFKKRNNYDLLFIILAFFSLIILLVNPSSVPTDIIILLPFFYYFVTKGIIRWWQIIQRNGIQCAMVGIPVFFLFGFLWLAILRALNLPPGSYEFAQMLIAIVGSLFLISLIFLLISWGWSVKVAAGGLSLGALAILLIFQLSIVFHSLGIISRPESEIWWNSKYILNSKEIKNEIEDIALWNTGVRNGLDIYLEGIHSPGLQWLLKDQNIKIVDFLPFDISTPIIITSALNQPLLEKNYRGQKLSLYGRPLWIQNPLQALNSTDFYRWLFFRDGMIERSDIYIWVRADLFAGNNIKFESRSN